MRTTIRLAALVVLLLDVPALAEVSTLFGRMGTFTEGGVPQPGPDPFIPHPSMNAVERAAKAHRLPSNILRAYQEQGLDPDLVGASIIKRLDAGEEFKAIVPLAIRERATELASDMQGVETWDEQLNDMTGGLLADPQKRILFADFYHPDGSSLTYVAEYRSAKCPKLLELFEEGLRKGAPDFQRGRFDCTAPMSEEVRAVFSGHKFSSPYITEVVEGFRKSYVFGGGRRSQLEAACEQVEAAFRGMGRDATCVR